MKNNEVKHNEPLFHISKRANIVWWKAWLVRIVAILGALLVSAVLTVLLTGENPLDVFSSLIKGAIGTNRRVWVLLPVPDSPKKSTARSLQTIVDV